MRIQVVCSSLALVLLTACGGGTPANVNARLSWSFDYKDWTDNMSTPDPRGCDNQPAQAGAVTPYLPIDSVRVLAVDPAGQIRGADQLYECAQGESAHIDVRGLAPQAWDVTIEANDANGPVYRLELPGLDLSAMIEEEYVLPAAVGELHFFAVYEGRTACEPGITELRYSLFRVATGGVETTATLTGVLPACDDGLPEVVLRGIPTDPEETFTGGWLSTQYEVLVEALDAGGAVAFCSRADRQVRPGRPSSAQDMALVAGASCP